jgi:hypothetical protein
MLRIAALLYLLARFAVSGIENSRSINLISQTLGDISAHGGYKKYIGATNIVRKEPEKINT